MCDEFEDIEVDEDIVCEETCERCEAVLDEDTARDADGFDGWGVLCDSCYDTIGVEDELDVEDDTVDVLVEFIEDLEGE